MATRESLLACLTVVPHGDGDAAALAVVVTTTSQTERLVWQWSSTTTDDKGATELADHIQSLSQSALTWVAFDVDDWTRFVLFFERHKSRKPLPEGKESLEP